MIQATMRLRWKRLAIWAAIVTGSGVCTGLLGELRFVQLLHLKALDTHFLAAGRRPAADIVLLTIDRKALETFRELRMFWHPYYAEAIRAAGENGARVVGLDLAFAVPVKQWAPDYDRQLTEAVTTSPIPVVCGYVPSSQGRQAEWAVPVNMASAALGLAGYANLTADPDDFVRRQELIESPAGGAGERPLARSFALLAAEKFSGSEAQLRGGQWYFEGRRIPESGPRSMVINYAGPPGTFPRVSLADFLAAARQGDKARLRAWVGGKIVLLGADTDDDRYATPFFTLFAGPKWTTAGVEIHANTIRTLLDHRYLEPVPGYQKGLAIFLVAALTAWIYAAFPLRRALVWLLAEAIAVVLGTHLLFRTGSLLSTSDLLLSLGLCLLASGTYRYACSERRGNLFRTAVAVFVGRRVATDLDQSEHIAQSASRQQVTVVFTDIRGFTAWCEARDPAAVVQALNAYLAVMVAAIVKHKGNVNKFIGDGILAIFSDEDGSRPGDHALRAVQCAMEMVMAPVPEFRTGAGINTGVAVVGNIGSADKLEYTVLGGTVNLASRLESMNKEHHTSLLMSESTAALLGGAVETACLGSVAVRGQTEAVRIYTAACLVGAAAEALTA